MNPIAIILAIAALGWAMAPAAAVASSLPNLLRTASESQRPDKAQQSAFVTPEQLVRDLKRPKPPIVVQVGVKALFQESHVPGAVHFRDVNTPEGKASFLADLKRLPQDRDIVLYCGCCPFDYCPFVQPAFSLANTMRGDRIKLLLLPNSFEEDWVAKGFPVEKP